MTESGDCQAAALTPLQEECYKLLGEKQYKSCEILAGMELARAEKEGRDMRVAWALLGSCAQLTERYNRAISFFRKIQYSFPSDPSSYKYRLKEAQCLQALGNIVEASSVLAIIPQEKRDLAMNMTLGNLYLVSGRNSNALECFLDGLRQNPYALEAVSWLAILGADPQHVEDAIRAGLESQASEADATNSKAQALIPLEEFIMAHFTGQRHQAPVALEQFQKLEKEFPNNIYLLLQIASLQVR